jgi:hypothetical protein
MKRVPADDPRGGQWVPAGRTPPTSAAQIPNQVSDDANRPSDVPDTVARSHDLVTKVGPNHHLGPTFGFPSEILTQAPQNAPRTPPPFD